VFARSRITWRPWPCWQRGSAPRILRPKSRRQGSCAAWKWSRRDAEEGLGRERDAAEPRCYFGAGGGGDTPIWGSSAGRATRGCRRSRRRRVFCWRGRCASVGGAHLGGSAILHQAERGKSEAIPPLEQEVQGLDLGEEGVRRRSLKNSAESCDPS